MSLTKKPIGKRNGYESLEQRHLLAADLVLQGTNDDDVIEYWAASNEFRLNQGIIQQIEDQVTGIRFEGGVGNDEAIIYGSDADETLLVKNNRATLTMEDRSFVAKSVETIQVSGGGGYDEAVVYDSAGDDYLRTRPGEATLEMDTGRVNVDDFDSIKVYATEGYDKADLHDSPNVGDQLITHSDRVTLTTADSVSFARYFDEFNAISSNPDGNDRVYMYDSNGDDKMWVTADYSRMLTSESDIKATGFARTYGFGSGGYDVVEFHDTPGDDSFDANDNYSRMFGGSIYAKVKHFERTVAFADAGGYDKAYLYDSAGDDLLIVSDERVRILGETLDNESVGFERNYSHARKGGIDYVRVYDEVFDEDDDVTSLMGTDRREKKDSISSDPDLVRLFSGSFYRRAEGFLITDVMEYNPDDLIGDFSEAGAVGVNEDFDNGLRSDYFIEMQRYGADLVTAGLGLSVLDSVDQGIEILQWGLDLQDADGSFPMTGDAVHSTSLFTEALGRAIVELDRFDYQPFQGQRDQWVNQLVASSHWMIDVDQDSQSVDLHDFAHRYFLRAVSLKVAAGLGGDAVLDAEADAYLQAGLTAQQSNGVLAERGGFDLSYQSLALKYAGDFYRITEDLQLLDGIRQAFVLSLPLIDARIDADGNVDLSDSSRINETTRSGSAKRFDYQNAIRAYLSGYEVTGDVAYLDLAQLLINNR